MRHDSRFGLAGCDNGILVRSALIALLLVAESEGALAAGEAEKTGLAAYEGIMLTVLYVFLGIFFVLLAWEIFDRNKQKKHEDDSMDIIDKEFKPAPSAPETPEQTSPIAPSDDDPFKALLNKAKDGEAPGPFVPKSGYKASGKPGLSTDSIRRGAAPKEEPETPVFDGSATIPVGVTVPRPADTAPRGLGDSAPMTRNLADAAPMTRDLGGSSAPVTKNLGGDDSSDPFRRLAKIGEEEQAMSSAASRPSSPAPASSSFGSQTLVAPVTPRPSQANDEDPWKKLLNQSAPAQAAAPGAARQPGMPGAMPGGARQPGMPGAMPGAATSKLSTAGAPAKVSLGTPGASKEDDPWKALLSGMSKPPAGSASIAPGAAPKESGEWPKAQSSRQRGISLDIKRGDTARMSPSPAGEE
ncbi:MAG: hypothetical protein K6G50_05165 [bacterium]|nr:hypothetical protein [bacterium]